jgi:hypothetical protein
MLGWPPGPDVAVTLRLKQRASGPRTSPEMEMESPRVEIPKLNVLYLVPGGERGFTLPRKELLRMSAHDLQVKISNRGLESHEVRSLKTISKGR